MKTKIKRIFPLFVLLMVPATAFAQTAPDVSASLTFSQIAASSSGGLLILAVAVGVVYNLWKTTRAFGGIIGAGLRRMGVGILFLTIEALERIAISFGSSGVMGGWTSSQYAPIVHNILFLMGLFFVLLGYKKLSSAAGN